MAHVLLVDDDECVRAVVEAALTRAGHDVALAANGFQALEMVKGSVATPDLVITDVNMPVMDGVATIAALHERLPSLPVIAITGSLADSPLYQAAKRSAHCVLSKPFTCRELTKMVANTLHLQES